MNAFSRVRPLPTNRTRLAVSAIKDWYWLLLAHEFSQHGGDLIMVSALVFRNAQMHVMDLNLIARRVINDSGSSVGCLFPVRRTRFRDGQPTFSGHSADAWQYASW